MTNVMLDIESIGSRQGDVVLSIGACKFNKDEVTDKFYVAIDVGDSLLHGFTVDYNTVRWWSGQKPEAIAPAWYGNRIPCHKAAYKFASFVDHNTLVWAKGPDFDCSMMAAFYEKLGIKMPWAYRNNRDVRTILAMHDTANQMPFEGVEHNALDDAIHQAKQIIQVYRDLGLRGL